MKTPLRLGALLLVVATTVHAQQSTPRVQENIERAKVQLGDALLTTADQVIAGHVEAVGGREALLSVKTLMFRGRYMRFGEADRHLYRYYQRPDLVRAGWSREGDTYTLCDGDTVWSVTPEGRRALDAWWAQSLSHTRIDDNFVDYRERGIEYEYVGLEAFETERSVYYHLRRTFPDGFVEDLYFDVETGLLHGIWKTTSPRKNDPCFYYDYKDVGGIRIPHMWATVFADASPPHILVVDEVRVNEDFGEEFFTAYKDKPILE